MRVAQAQLMEYMLLTLFILLIIVMLSLFLAGWQITGLEKEQKKSVQEFVISIINDIGTSPYINKQEYVEGFVFSDSILTVLDCDDIRRMFSDNIFVTIEVVSNQLGSIECSKSNYPMCGKWSYCYEEDKNFIAYEVPVNIYRRADGSILSAIMRIGIYE